MKSGIVLYDFLVARGGAEAVFFKTLGALPSARGVAAFARPDLFDRAMLQRVTFLSKPIRSRYLWALTLPLSFLFARRIVHAADRWIIFSGIYTPFLALSITSQTTILYCHTPPRFCGDLKKEHRDALPVLLRPAFDIYCAIFAKLYGMAIKRMDVVFANSLNVQQRLMSSFGVGSTLLYPPVSVERYAFLNDDGYYLSTSRLEEYKRVDVIVRTFKLMPMRRLVITSGGSQLAALKRLAGDAPNIKFTDWVTDEQLIDLVGRCTATIYIPTNEDFGISPVESQAAGKPVIGVKEGGLTETVIDGKTGILIDGNVTEDKLMTALVKLESIPKQQLRDACETNARRFSDTAFTQTLQEVVSR